MPMYELQCINGHRREVYCHARLDVYNYWDCDVCMHTMGTVMSQSKPLTYFRENNGQWIHNMSHEPVYVTSAEEHKRLMKKHGVTFATPKRGEKGCWA